MPDMLQWQTHAAGMIEEMAAKRRRGGGKKEEEMKKEHGHNGREQR